MKSAAKRKVFVSPHEAGAQILWELRKFARKQDSEKFAILDWCDAQKLVQLFDSGKS